MPPKKESSNEERDPLKQLFDLFADNRYVSKGSTGIFRAVLLYFLFDQWRIIQTVPELTRKVEAQDRQFKEYQQRLERLENAVRTHGWQVSTKDLIGTAPASE